MKFTEEIKQNWIKALESGDYIQGKAGLVSKKNSKWSISGKTEYCCLGVLGKITPGLSEDIKINVENLSTCPYYFMTNNFGTNTGIIKANDNWEYWKNNPPQDYSNVLPLIRKLKTNG